MNFYFHGKCSYRNAEGDWTSSWCTRHMRVWKHNTIIIWIHNVFRAQGERIKKMSSLEENFITLAEQFRVLVWPFGKICRKSKNGTKPVDPWHFPSHPCFSSLSSPPSAPNWNHLGRLFNYVVASTFSGSMSLRDFKGVTCSSTWSWRLQCQGPPARKPLVSLGWCQVTSSARVSLCRSGPAHSWGIPWKLCKPKMRDV